MRFFIWAIRVILLASFIGILFVLLFPKLSADLRITSIGAALQVAGLAFVLPDLAEKLIKKTGTELVTWAETFFPLWKILSKIIRIKMTLGALRGVLLVLGIAFIFFGLIMQYLAVFFLEG